MLSNEQAMEQAAKILFTGMWEGGNGENFKAPYANKPVKTFGSMKGSRYLCGCLKENVRLVDFDNGFITAVKIAKAMKEHCIAIQSPTNEDRGHIYYFDNQNRLLVSNSGNKTVLTFSPVDYKCGSRLVKSTGEVKAAKAAGSISNPDGSFRTIQYFNPAPDATLDEVPFYHLPLKSGNKHEFCGMGEGDGRQDGLFTYMNPMKAAGFTYEQYATAAGLINSFLFETPMEPDEFENAIRREAWDALSAVNSANFYEGTQFQHDKMGEFLKAQYSVKKINGQLHIFNSGVYEPGREAVQKIMVQLVPKLKTAQRKEVLDYLNLTSDEAIVDSKVIAFSNGLYDTVAHTMKPYNPLCVVTNRIPWDYNQGASAPLIDKVLDRLSCGDAAIRSLLEEVAGSCLYRESPMLGGGKAVILSGEKNNGKSTFDDLLKTMLGNSNYSSLDLNALGGRFDTITLYGKLANIGDDISGLYIQDVSTFKKIVTGDTIKAEEKGVPSTQFSPYSTLIFSANDIPRMNDPTGAALRRLLIVPMNATFSETDADFDPEIRTKLEQRDCIEYFIRLAVAGLERVLLNRRFTVPEKVQNEKDQYERENNPILAFIEEVGEDSVINEPTSEVYRRYALFCSENGFGQMNNLTFSKRMNQRLGTITKDCRYPDGSKCKTFVKPD